MSLQVMMNTLFLNYDIYSIKKSEKKCFYNSLELSQDVIDSK